MPEHSSPAPPHWAPAPPPGRGPDSAGRAVATALGTSAILTLIWGLLSALTGSHYLVLLPVIGAILAVALTSTPARRAWFPLIAAALGFAIGYLGDIAAVSLLLWRHGYGATLILGHLPQLAGAVNTNHTAGDWGYFLASGAIAALTTAARQKARPTGPTPPTPR
jgi:hypothetical protein